MNPAELLRPALLAQLERVQLGTRRRLVGRFAGEHRSPSFGTSVDFADYREYQPGDDFRRIDYPLYARTGDLFLRLFEAEDNVTLRLLVDRSGSMGLHGKLDQAVRLAAAIGFVALVNRDTVVLHTEPPAGPPRRFSGRSATRALFTDLAALTSSGRTDLGAGARHVAAQVGGAGLTIVISDLLTATVDGAVDRLLARAGDVSVVHLVADDELHPDLRGDLEMVDVETGDEVPASMSPAAIAEYERHVADWLRDAERSCRRRGAAYARVGAADDLGDVLLRGWRRDGLVR